ncbi:UvrD-helicase domain-containing protein [Bacillus massiliigorillae]|uniref:UvrD-helicase domain-containing protein n=1 Tax=Bacillus massiliigorillae TaxID=1243664 RepID=UPI0003A6CEC2|nr:UvrD-helicase domain-containing protein [Bacillus massiliigorillae]
MQIKQKRKIIDQEQRDAILQDRESIVVSASAGSGKTTIMVQKLGLELNNIKNHKTVAAITFTVKAKEEIKKKSSSITDETFVAMTNDSFVESEIIRPFIQDAFGKEYSKEYTVEYGADFKFDSFEDGLEQLKQQKILGTFRNNKENFNFRLALKVLEKSVACQEYLKAKYEMIFIDEYQDSDLDMHLLFMKLKESLNIRLFIVGDKKQAIYTWRGAMHNIFDLLDQGFTKYELVTNFRCDEEIENYANLIHNHKYFKVSRNETSNVIFMNSNHNSFNFNSFSADFQRLLDNNSIDINKEITILANYNNDAINITNRLNEAGFNFVFIPRTPIDEGLPNGLILKELAFFIKNTNSVYSIHDFLEKLQIDDKRQVRINIENIIKKLRNKEVVKAEYITNVLYELFAFLGVSISEEEISKFCISVCDDQYDMAFRLAEERHKVMTVFASKGLEFDQVISFSKYYKIYNNENLENHYVCVTRAKEKFVMFIDDFLYYEYIAELSKDSKIENLNRILCYKD